MDTDHDTLITEFCGITASDPDTVMTRLHFCPQGKTANNHLRPDQLLSLQTGTSTKQSPFSLPPVISPQSQSSKTKTTTWQTTNHSDHNSHNAVRHEHLVHRDQPPAHPDFAQFEIYKGHKTSLKMTIKRTQICLPVEKNQD